MCNLGHKSCIFFNDTATTEIYTLSLHDALPILGLRWTGRSRSTSPTSRTGESRSSLQRDGFWRPSRDRKSTRLNSSHANISYAVFCLKKRKEYVKSLANQKERPY